MSLCKSQCWYSFNCLHFLKRAVHFAAATHTTKINNMIGGMCHESVNLNEMSMVAKASRNLEIYE